MNRYELIGALAPMINAFAPIIGMCVGFYIARLYNQGKIWAVKLTLGLITLIITVCISLIFYQAFTE